MSKGQAAGEKTEKLSKSEKSHEKSSDRPQDKSDKSKEISTHEAKRPETPSAKGKNALAGIGGCVATGCKANSTRFNFCEEHYDHFKFGLIKKTGDPVPDYEKKFEHYTAYKAKQKGKKVA